jgi:hypothetical protein
VFQGRRRRPRPRRLLGAVGDPDAARDRAHRPPVPLRRTPGAIPVAATTSRIRTVAPVKGVAHTALAAQLGVSLQSEARVGPRNTRDWHVDGCPTSVMILHCRPPLNHVLRSPGCLRNRSAPNPRRDGRCTGSYCRSLTSLAMRAGLEPFFEFSQPNGPNRRLSADIALVQGETPIWLIEAKRFTQNLHPDLIAPYLKSGCYGRRHQWQSLDLQRQKANNYTRSAFD